MCSSTVIPDFIKTTNFEQTSYIIVQTLCRCLILPLLLPECYFTLGILSLSPMICVESKQCYIIYRLPLRCHLCNYIEARMYASVKMSSAKRQPFWLGLSVLRGPIFTSDLMGYRGNYTNKNAVPIVLANYHTVSHLSYLGPFWHGAGSQMWLTIFSKHYSGINHDIGSSSRVILTDGGGRSLGVESAHKIGRAFFPETEDVWQPKTLRFCRTDQASFIFGMTKWITRT